MIGVESEYDKVWVNVTNPFEHAQKIGKWLWSGLARTTTYHEVPLNKPICCQPRVIEETKFTLGFRKRYIPASKYSPKGDKQNYRREK